MWEAIRVRKKPYTWSGDIAHTFLKGCKWGRGKHILGGGTPHILFDGANNWVGTPHNIERKSLAVGGEM